MKGKSESRKRGARLFTALSLSVMLSACATLGVGSGQTSKYPKVSNTIVQACGAGTLLGFLKIMYEDVVQGKRRRLKDYLKEGAIYGLAGCTVGFVLENKRSKYASTAEYYDAEIASTRALNAEMKSVNSHLFSRTQANNAALKELQAQKKVAGVNAAAALEARNTAKADLDWALRQLENALASLATQEALLAENDSELSGQKKASLQQEVMQLAEYVNILEKEVGYMNNINDALVKM